MVGQIGERTAYEPSSHLMMSPYLATQPAHAMLTEDDTSLGDSGRAYDPRACVNLKKKVLESSWSAGGTTAQLHQ